MKTQGFFPRIIIFILTTALFLSSSVYAEETGRTAIIADFQGQVDIMKGGGEQQFPAFKNMRLEEADRIVTGDSSWAIIEIDDDKEIKLSENSYISLSELSGIIQAQDDKTSVRLITGKIWTAIKNKLNKKQKYEVKTSTAVMGVRGTKFYISMSDAATDVAVLDGSVSTLPYRIYLDTSSVSDTSQVEIVLVKDQQLTLGGRDAEASEPQIREVSLDDFDLYILEAIRQNPEGISDRLLQDIDRAIEKKQEEKRQAEEKAEGETKPVIIYDETVTNTSTPSGGASTPSSNSDPADSSASGNGSNSSGGGRGGSGYPLLPSSITLNQSSLTLYPGQNEALVATLLPSTATNRSVGWNSSNPDVAAVDSSGLVTALRPGSAVITVQTAASAVRAACPVTVTAPEITAAWFEGLNTATSAIHAAFADNTWEMGHLPAGNIFTAGQSRLIVKIKAANQAGISASCSVQASGDGGSTYTAFNPGASSGLTDSDGVVQLTFTIAGNHAADYLGTDVYIRLTDFKRNGYSTALSKNALHFTAGPLPATASVEDVRLTGLNSVTAAVYGSLDSATWTLSPLPSGPVFISGQTAFYIQLKTNQPAGIPVTSSLHLFNLDVSTSVYGSLSVTQAVYTGASGEALLEFKVNSSGDSGLFGSNVRLKLADLLVGGTAVSAENNDIRYTAAAGLPEIALTVPPIVSIEAGKTQQLQVTTTPPDAAISFDSTNTAHAVVSSSGLITGIGPGTSRITVIASKAGYQQNSTSFDIQVNKMTASPASIDAGSTFGTEFLLNIQGGGYFNSTLDIHQVQLSMDFSGLSVSSIARDAAYPNKAHVLVLGVPSGTAGTGAITVSSGGWSGGHPLTARVNVMNPDDISWLTDTFDKNTADESTGHYNDVELQIKLHGKTLTDIRKGEISMDPSAYTVNIDGDTACITLKKEYLATLPLASVTPVAFTFHVSDGHYLVFQLYIHDSASNASFCSDFAASRFSTAADDMNRLYDDVEILVDMHGNTAFTITDDQRSLVVGEGNYTVSDIEPEPGFWLKKIVLKKEYLCSLPEGSIPLTLRFDKGYPLHYTIYSGRTEWYSVGNPGISAGAVSEVSVAAAGDKTYLAYIDSTADNKAVVLFSQNGLWVDTGEIMDSFGELANKVRSLAIYPFGNDIYLAYYREGATRRVFLERYDSSGHAWEVVGGIDLTSTAAAEHISLFVCESADGPVPYLAYRNTDMNKYRTIRYRPNDFSEDLSTEYAYSGAITRASLFVDRGGGGVPIPYVALAHDDKVEVKTLSGLGISGTITGGNWNTVAGSMFDASSNTGVSLYVLDHTLYLAFKDDTGSICLKKMTGYSWNGSSWENPVWTDLPSPGTAAGTAEKVSLFAGSEDDGTGVSTPAVYISYISDTNKAVVKKYFGTTHTWVSYDAEIQVAGSAESLSMSVGNGILSYAPTIAFRDNGNAGKATVYTMDFHVVGNAYGVMQHPQPNEFVYASPDEISGIVVNTNITSEKDLKTVTVRVRKTGGDYLTANNGGFTSPTPVDLTVTADADVWTVSLTNVTFLTGDYDVEIITNDGGGDRVTITHFTVWNAT